MIRDVKVMFFMMQALLWHSPILCECISPVSYPILVIPVLFFLDLPVTLFWKIIMSTIIMATEFVPALC